MGNSGLEARREKALECLMRPLPSSELKRSAGSEHHCNRNQPPSRFVPITSNVSCGHVLFLCDVFVGLVEVCNACVGLVY